MKNNVTVHRSDKWPSRDQVCHRVAYNFDGAEAAVKRCKKLDLAIQAGGCVGAWPKYLRTRFAKVYTFEPSAENFDLMAQNLKGWDVISFHAALSDKVGRCGIKQNPLNCGDDQTIEGDVVDTITIDSLGLDPDLIYLDIQGDELKALKGAQMTLSRCSPIIGIEVDDHLSRLKGDAVNFLTDLGYVKFATTGQDLLFERAL